MNKGSPIGSGVRTKYKMLFRRKQLSTLEATVIIWLILSGTLEGSNCQHWNTVGEGSGIWRGTWPLEGTRSRPWRQLGADQLEPGAGSRNWHRRTATWCTRNLPRENGRGVDGDGPQGGGDQGRRRGRGWELELAIGLLPPPPPRKTRGDVNWSSRDGDRGRVIAGTPEIAGWVLPSLDFEFSLNSNDLDMFGFFL